MSILNDLIKDTRFSYEQELNDIQKWLFDNDWKVNKIVVGEWQEDDERWLVYKNERAIKRTRQDELNALLGNN